MSEPHFFADVRAAMGTGKPAPAATTYSPAQFAGNIPPYAAAALTAETMAVAAAPAGTRNDTLNIAAVKLGSLVAGGHLPPVMVLQELTAAAEAAGLEPAEIRATLNSGLRKGEQTPREIPDTDKETEQWLNDVTTGQAPRSGSANGSTPGQPPRDGGPTPENGTQPPTPSSTPSPTFDPWAQPAGPGDSLTAGPSSSPALPWEKNTAHASTAATADTRTGPTAAPNTTNTGPATSTPTATGEPWNTQQNPTIYGQAWASQSPNLTAPDGSPAVSAESPKTGNGTYPGSPDSGTYGSPNHQHAAADPLGIPAALLDRDTALEYLRLKARDGAARMLRKSNNPATAPQPVNLAQFLQQPDEEAVYRVQGLWPAGGRAVLAAQYKAGKTSLMANLIKSLADGGTFLDYFVANPVNRIALIDNEMAPAQIRRWYRDQQIANPEKVGIVPLRGAISTFDILDPITRGEWARRLYGADVIILDCLRPVLDALGLDENRDAGKFLAAFDELLKMTSANPDMPTEAIVVHHIGHGGERSRGDSRILDWPDATWTMTRENLTDENSARYFKAFGRDVKVEESLLDWNGMTRQIRLLPGATKQAAKVDGLTAAVLETVQQYEGTTVNSLIGIARGAGHKFNDKDFKAALQLAVDREQILKVKRSGPGGGFAYFPKIKPRLS